MIDIKNLIKNIDIRRQEKETINPIHEIVNLYYRMKGYEHMHQSFYKGRYGYGKLAKEAKMLYVACQENLPDALWALDAMKYKAEKGGFDWSISTCLKHHL